jgi:signal transduction histidine kinase
MGDKAYQFLTACISTALSGSILLDKLDLTYGKLIEESQREGMADIASGILHNIGNILNSVNASANIIEGLANSSAFSDLMGANRLLEMNMNNLNDFFSNNVKAKKLMRFYLSLGDAFTDIQQQLYYHTDRLNDKVNFINEIIISQQNYAGVNTILEEIDIVSILEDVIKLIAASIEKYHINIVRDFQSAPRIIFQRLKMFHILLNLINNSIEAMLESDGNERILKFTVYEDISGKYIQITDSGCGIPESTLERIFSKGYTTKRGRQGIGLNSCVTYLAEMEGEVCAESEGAGKGATFIIKFK